MSATSQLAVEAQSTTVEQQTAAELWQDVSLFSGLVRQAELAVSNLSLQRDWYAAEEMDALAAHNELWQEEQYARRVARREQNNPAKDQGSDEEIQFLLSWADAARDLRHSDAVDWRYLCSAHKLGQAEDRLKEARQHLKALRRVLYSLVQSALTY
jgi:hypothetical protein